jgi:hypothetical protein
MTGGVVDIDRVKRSLGISEGRSKLPGRGGAWPRVRIVAELRREDEAHFYLWDGRTRRGHAVIVKVPKLYVTRLAERIFCVPEWMAYDRGFIE